MRPFVPQRVLLPAAVLLTIAATAGAQLYLRNPQRSSTSVDEPAAQFRATEDLSPHSFYFTRAQYSGGGRGWRRINSWATDFDKADLQFLTVLRRLTNIDAFDDANVVSLDDPELRRFPLIYAVEVGYMSLTPEERQGLRDYLLAGGFLVVDDFWGTYEWENFEQEIKAVLPEYPIEELPPTHPIFSAMYTVNEVIQVPNVQNGIDGWTTSERDGIVPHLRGISDENGRLLVAINWNTDLGDAWEWAEQPRYPLRFSTYAYEMGANFIVYAMSH
jgi:hypothetical protein